jgi:hypothetical protein
MPDRPASRIAETAIVDAVGVSRFRVRPLETERPRATALDPILN